MAEPTFKIMRRRISGFTGYGSTCRSGRGCRRHKARWVPVDMARWDALAAQHRAASPAWARVLTWRALSISFGAIVAVLASLTERHLLFVHFWEQSGQSLAAA
jgi:hypothetical protein